MKRFMTFMFSLLAISVVNSQTTLASWSFEGVTVATAAGTTLNITAGGAAADAGTLATSSAVSAVHASASTVYSTPGGNGSTKSLSSNFWAVGDYYQFKVATTGFNGIKASWDHTGSNTGPALFKLQYSVTAGGASGYTDVSTYTIPNRIPSATTSVTWNTTTPIALDSTTFRGDLTAISAVNNQSEVYFRIVCTATVAIATTFGTGGTSRVDNFKVTAETAIPVELVKFTAQKEKSAAKLAWTTATELNNAFYAIERSTDGKDFEKIGEVSGYGNSQQLRNYTFMDEKPSNTVNYYRLRQVDLDGKETVSKTVSVNFDKNASIKVYPAIASDKINVEINADGGADLTIVNMMGQVVKSQKVANTEGVLPISISDLPNGSYIIHMVSKTGEMTQRFEKQ